jgi:hypothetical protein
MGALYLQITTDKTGAVARVDFLNKVADYVQEWIRNKIMGQHFGAGWQFHKALVMTFRAKDALPLVARPQVIERRSYSIRSGGCQTLKSSVKEFRLDPSAS